MNHCILGTECLYQALVNVFLQAVSFKGGPQPPGNAEEMVSSCLLVSVLQLEQKVSFDLGIKEVGNRMLGEG